MDPQQNRRNEIITPKRRHGEFGPANILHKNPKWDGVLGQARPGSAFSRKPMAGEARPDCVVNGLREKY